MQITVSGITVAVVKKKIKNLHLRVKAPDGRVELSAPVGLSNGKIEEFLRDKRDWILQQQGKFSQQTDQMARDYVSGELLYVWGQPYRLEVGQGKRNQLVLERGRALLTVREGSTREQRERWVNEWYRTQLKEAVGRLLPKWEAITGLHPDSWQSKNMTTRWGTCNVRDRRIWLNLQLAKYPAECLEYVILHELTHLVEKGHNQRFYAHMDRYMPRWRQVRKQLNGQKD